MIYLESDINRAKKLFSVFDYNSFLAATVGHYLDVYGLSYSFQELYIQINDAEDVCAFLLRYNSTVYCVISESANPEELLPFLSGFSDCEIISEIDTEVLRNFGFPAETLYELKRNGCRFPGSGESLLEISNTATAALSSLKEHLSSSKFEDFLLNMSFQHRHEKLKLFAKVMNDEYTCVVGVSDAYSDVKTIPFLYTKKDFRGNKFAQNLLDFACCENSEYYLICEEFNLDFYKKCNFTQVSTLSRIQL